MPFTFSAAEAGLLYNFLASVLVPFIVSLIARTTWSGTQKFLLALVMSVVGGALSVYAAGELDAASVVGATLIVFTASQAHFASWFSGLGLNDTLLKLGSKS